MPIVLTITAPVTSQALNALRAASWEGAQPRDWTPVLERSLGWVCATDSDRLVGFVRVLWDGGAHTFLLDTTVHGDYQRRGIGTSLVMEAISLARTSGAEWLHVDYAEELEAFYGGCGFRPTRAGLVRLTDNAAARASRSKQKGA